jgi:hypothetical protein
MMTDTSTSFSAKHIINSKGATSQPKDRTFQQDQRVHFQKWTEIPGTSVLCDNNDDSRSSRVEMPLHNCAWKDIRWLLYTGLLRLTGVIPHEIEQP